MQIHEITEGILKGVNSAPMAAPALPGKASFARNAAEFFANKTLNAVGVPADQQGEYHPGGHMAALQGRSTAKIESQEERIATQLATEFAEKGTVNGKIFNTYADVADAAEKINNATYNRLPIEPKRIVNSFVKKFIDAKKAAGVTNTGPSGMNPNVNYNIPAYQRKQPTSTAPAAPTLDPKDYAEDPATQQLIAAAKKQGKL